MNRRKKVTLDDVSRHSGFSLATVSMILSGRQDVSFMPETVRKVQETARELGYARLRKKQQELFRRKTILVVCPTIVNTYYSTLVQSIQNTAAAREVDSLVYTTYRDPANEERILALAEQSDIGGILFAMVPQCTELVERVDRKIPIIVIGDPSTRLNVDMVELNNYDAGALIATHLAELGHRRIAYISTPLNAANTARVRRLEGIRDAFAGACNGTVRVYSRDVSPQQERENIYLEHTVGLELGRTALEDPSLTAFVAINDMVAYGVVEAIRAAGRSIPGDYSVCGFDNIFPSGFPEVGLTTVEHNMVDKGRVAFTILYEKMCGRAGGRITRVEYRPRLIVRASTGKPR